MSHWKDDCFYQFLNLFIQTTDIIVIFRRLFINFHCFYSGIIPNRALVTAMGRRAAITYSGGRVSKIKKLSLFTPMISPGFRVSGSTRPISGKKTVYDTIVRNTYIRRIRQWMLTWRVEVLITAHFPLRLESRSTFAPSSSSSSGSISRSW